MCIVEKKTYVYPDGRTDVVEKERRCRNAPRSGLCQNFVYKDADVARVVEVRPSSSRESPSERDSRRYQTVSRRNSTRNPSGRSPRAGNSSPADSLSPGAPSFRPSYEEVRPPAPMPPPVSTGYPSARHSGTILPPDPRRTVGRDGTEPYGRPPSREMPRADQNQRFISRPPSFSSTAADVDEPETPPPKRRVSFRERRPSNVTIDVDAASANIAPSGMRASPGLSSLPNPFAETIPRSKGKSHARVDSRADDIQRQQQEDDRQARIVREQIAASERRQQQRIRNVQAEEAARQRAADLERERAESFRERKEHARRKTRAALEGEDQSRRDTEMQRKLDAELVQLAREKADADARKRASAEQYQALRSSPISARNSYTFPTPSSPTVSTRTAAPLSARTSVTLHHYPTPRPNSLSERGDKVIAREQDRAEKMSAAMAGMALDEGEDEDAIENDDPGVRSTPSRRRRRESREQRNQKERRLRDEGYY